MKTTLLLFASICLAVFSLNAQNYDTVALRNYVEANKAYAIESMHLHKVPASITLAQGIYHTRLASNHLAKHANNHFSITCAKTDVDNRYHQDNNMANICFRKYATVRDSYIDHGVYLSTKAHYKSLFSLDIYDYKAWANELQNLSYSISKNYAQNLINIIEKYNLAQYDYPEKAAVEEKTAPAEETTPTVTPSTPAVQPEITEKPVDTTNTIRAEQAVKPIEGTTSVNTKDSLKNELMSLPVSAETQEIQKEKSIVKTEISAHPTTENIEKAPEQKSELLFFTVNEFEQKKVRYPLSDRNVYEREGVKFLIAKAGDTFKKLAEELQFTENRLREYNDVYDEETELHEGEVVYLEMKNRKCDVEFHTIQYGETLRYIAQKYAIQLIVILKNNGESGYSLNEEICISCD